MDTSLYHLIDFKEILNKLAAGVNLTADEAYKVFSQFEEDPNPIDLTAFLVLLKAKGETGDELSGMVDFLSQKMKLVTPTIPTLDIVGTGGAGANTVNISTGAAIVASACGVPIAKHGNRSSSSQCGAADLIESLGIPLEISPEQAQKSIEQIQLAFLYAPFYHPFIKHFQPIRSRLKIRTVFNLLGPLLNPAMAAFRIVGVSDKKMMGPIGEALEKLEIRRALVCHGYGLDELSTLGPAEALLIEGKKTTTITIDPKKFGFKEITIEELQGGDPETNCSLLLEALGSGKGGIADTLALNAGTAVWLYGKTPDLTKGIEEARSVLQDGKAYEKLQEWIAYARANSQ